MTSIIRKRVSRHVQFICLSMTPLLLYIFLSGCSTTGNNEYELTVGALNGPSGISLVKMMESNSDRLGEADETYVIKNDPELIKTMMIRKELDIALLPFNTAVLLYNRGIDYQLVGVPIWGSLFVVGNDTTIHSIQDLRGKTIHNMGRGMTPDIMLRYILIQKGIDPDRDVIIDYTFPTPLELASAIQGNKVPLGITAEPMLSITLKKNEEMNLLLDLSSIWEELQPNQTPIPQTALVVRRNWAVKHPEKLKSWCEMYAKSIEWINQNPKIAGELISKHGITKAEFSAPEMIERCRLEFDFDQDDHNTIITYLNSLQSLNGNLIGNKLPDGEFYYQK